MQGLLKYQREFLYLPRYNENGTGAVRTLVKSRRIGGSFAAGFEAVLQATGHQLTPEGVIKTQPSDVFVISASHAQSIEFISTAGNIAAALAKTDPAFAANVKAKSIDLKATNTRIQSLPCKASSLRGYTGAVILDEAAFFQNFGDVFQSSLPITKPNIRNKNGYSLTMITTPWLAGSECHDAFTNPDRGFHRLEVDIYKAVADGFPINPEDIKREIGSEAKFQTEYECKWIGGSGSFFAADALAKAMVSPDDVPAHVLALPRTYGLDVGRSADLTALCETVVDDEGVVWVLSIKTISNMALDLQTEVIRNEILGKRLERIRIDAGGIGVTIADILERYFDSKLERFFLNALTQQDFAVSFKEKLTDQKIRIVMSDADAVRNLITEICMLSVEPTANGGIRLVIPHVNGTHCDSAVSLLLAIGGRDTSQDLGAYCGEVFDKDFELRSLW